MQTDDALSYVAELTRVCLGMVMGPGRQAPSINGCLVLGHRYNRDDRGTFSKVLSSDNHQQRNSEFVVRELFWSRSQRGVIRGMHLQTPPHATSKFVWVSQGQIRDVVLDLRTDSETFEAYLVTPLSDESGGIFIPPGCAHGFEVLSDTAVVNYAQNGDYTSSHDTGVAWDSFGFNWKTKTPILSDRDRSLPRMSDFESPFTMSNTT